MVRPPGMLVKSFAILPSSTAITGVPRGAGMSSASCFRMPPRLSLNVSDSCMALTPSTGTSSRSAANAVPDLISNTGQQRNVVLHPEFVNGKYALYTRPQDGFIDVGNGGGIGLGFVDTMANPVVKDEKIIFGKIYHTIYELKNGLGPAPIKTSKGWLHMAHGVRNTAAGLRYTTYLFMTDLHDISKVTHVPAGHFLAPEGIERIGDVSNVLFSNGWIEDPNGTVYIYYASSDTRMHVAVSTIDKLVDYVMNSPTDTFTSAGSVNTIIDLVNRNKEIL